MASDCCATTARLEIFMDKNFVGAPKVTNSIKILVLEIFWLYSILIGIVIVNVL